MEFLSDAYGALWRLKYRVNKENRSDANRNLVKVLANKRIDISRQFISSARYSMKKKKIHTILDMIKCYMWVFYFDEAARDMAAMLIDYLLENSEEIKYFQKLTGVHVCGVLNKNIIISDIIKLYA